MIINTGRIAIPLLTALFAFGCSTTTSTLRQASDIAGAAADLSCAVDGSCTSQSQASTASPSRAPVNELNRDYSYIVYQNEGKIWQVMQRCQGGDPIMCLAMSDYKYEKDPKDSFRWAKSSCEKLDHPLSCYRTAQMHESGYGPGKIDRKKASALYGQACDLGLAEACERR